MLPIPKLSTETKCDVIAVGAVVATVLLTCKPAAAYTCDGDPCEPKSLVKDLVCVVGIAALAAVAMVAWAGPEVLL